MKPLVIIALALAVAGCTDSQSGASQADLEYAAEAGRRAAEHALQLPEGSMEREDAILNIRSQETLLRRHGFESCADTFAASAERILFPAPSH